MITRMFVNVWKGEVSSGCLLKCDVVGDEVECDVTVDQCDVRSPRGSREFLNARIHERLLASCNERVSFVCVFTIPNGGTMTS